MPILISILVKILEWLLVLGGRAAFEWADKKVQEHKQAKKDKDNVEAIKKAIAEKKFQDAADEMTRLANGQGKK